MSSNENLPADPARDDAARADRLGRGGLAHAGLREITDARTLRALTHPVRIAIIEELTVGGPMTATEVGDRIGETPTTCSFHLRQLARYGFVQEAGGGKGRARPWKMSSVGMSFTHNSGDPAADLATTALVRLMRERQLSRYDAWRETRSAYPQRWQDASFDDQWLFYLTADELDAVGTELRELLVPRFLERITDPARRPPGAVPVEMLMISYPLEMPAGEPGADGGGPPEGGQPEGAQ